MRGEIALPRPRLCLFWSVSVYTHRVEVRCYRFVSIHGTNENAGRNIAKFREVTVEHDFFAPDQVDAAGGAFYGNDGWGFVLFYNFDHYRIH